MPSLPKLASVLFRLPGSRAARPAPGTSRRVLVTGGASGLGLALTRAFLDRGDRVIVADLAPVFERPESVPAEAGYLRLDVSSEEHWLAARDEIERTWGGLDVLVNNAGIAQGGRIDRLTEKDWERILDVNVHGVARGCRTFVPLLRRQRSGHIVNTASLAGHAYAPGMSSYAAVKAAVVALSESLRWELGPHGIDVSVICPGFFRTNLASSLNASDPAAAEFAAKLIARSPYSAEQIAAWVMEGLDQRRFLILPDPESRKTYLAKRFATALYNHEMRKMGRRLAAEAKA